MQYTAETLSGHTFEFYADLEDPDAALYAICVESGERLETPYISADVRDSMSAAEWVGDYLGECSDEDPVASVLSVDAYEGEPLTGDEWFDAAGDLASLSEEDTLSWM